jgi:hypothetical protein
MVSVWPQDMSMIANYDLVNINTLPTDFSIDLLVNDELIVIESEIDTFEAGGFVYKIPEETDCLEIMDFDEISFNTGYRLYKVKAKSEVCEEELQIELADWVTDMQAL